MGSQMAGPTYCGWVQVVVLDRFPLLQDPQFLESLYQQLYLHFTDLFEIYGSSLNFSWYLVYVIYKNRKNDTTKDIPNDCVSR